jgi:hypothetical protein
MISIADTIPADYEPGSVSTFFVYLAYFLGVTKFKKYWPGSGSCWKTFHANRNSISDMEVIIRNAREYASIHLRSLILESIAYTLVLLGSHWNSFANTKFTIYVAVAMSTLHLYPLLVQHYNIVMAKRRIVQLKKIPPTQEELENKLYIHVCSDSYETRLYRVNVGYTIWGPLQTKENAISYRDFLLQRYGGFLIPEMDDEAAFLDNKRDAYRAWKLQHSTS